MWTKSWLSCPYETREARGKKGCSWKARGAATVCSNLAIISEVHDLDMNLMQPNQFFFFRDTQIWQDRAALKNKSQTRNEGHLDCTRLGAPRSSQRRWWLLLKNWYVLYYQWTQARDFYRDNRLFFVLYCNNHFLFIDTRRNIWDALCVIRLCVYKKKVNSRTRFASRWDARWILDTKFVL